MRETIHELNGEGWTCPYCKTTNYPHQKGDLAEAVFQRRDGRGGIRLVVAENPASVNPASAKPEDLRGEALERFDCDPAVARAVYETAGLVFEPDLNQMWRVGEHELTVSLWVDPKRRHITHLVGGWPPEITRRRGSTPTDLALAEVYAISLSRVLFLPRGPEMARWKRRLLHDVGLVEAAPVDLRPLPIGSPDSAVTTWQVIQTLLELRGLTDPSDELPLSCPFLSRWTRMDENVFRRGKYWLEKQGFIWRTGEAPSRGGGRSTVIWGVALHGAETVHQEERS
jgi:hypothetical protein